MKSLFYKLFGAIVLVAYISGCATVPAPEVEAMTLDIPSYVAENLKVSYHPARELQFGNMTCLLDKKVTPENYQVGMAFACDEFRASAVTVTFGWKRTSLSPVEVEKKVSYSMRLRSRLGPLEDSGKDVQSCVEEKIDRIKDKGVLLRCQVDFFTTQRIHKRATFSVFYLNPQEKIDYQPFVITEGSFGRGDDEAQRDAVVYGESLEWVKEEKQ